VARIRKLQRQGGTVIRKILLAIALFLLCFTPADAAYLDLAWDPNTDPDLAGYRVYYGTASREYLDSIYVGNTTTYRLDGLLEGVMYYIAVTAYDLYSNESDFSDEVSSYTGGDGMPDDWETKYFGDTNQEPESTPSGGGGCFIASAAFSSDMPMIKHSQQSPPSELGS